MGVATSATLVLAVGAALVIYQRSRRSKSLPLPPGPKGWPLIGNLLDMPSEQQWITYARWAKEYGPLTYLNLLGSPMIIINDHQASKDLLDARQAIYSHRTAKDPKYRDYHGMDWMITWLSGEKHRRRRAIVLRYFSGEAAKKHQNIQVDETRVLIKNLVDDPKHLFEHLKLFGANIVMLGAYGIRAEKHDDSRIVEIDKALAAAEEGGVMEHIVNAFPFLMGYPKWFPFSGFRIRAEQSVRIVEECCRYRPFNECKAMLANGTAVPCFTTHMLEELEKGRLQSDEEDLEVLIRDCAGVMYGAGVESTNTIMACLFLAYALFPEPMKKAQEEVDRVIGTDRLPNFSDRSQLPYINATVLELLRYCGITPIGFPHTAAKDDTYLGYLIPKGSMMTGNFWLMCNDPDIFPNPERFEPERFLGDDCQAQKDVVGHVWGWGRRACPGRVLAEASFFISISHIASCLNITRCKDSQGNPLPLSAKFNNGFVRRPLPFEVDINYRDEARAFMINQL